MAGTINSLGLGSGTLTGDIIDKLKAADRAKKVAPFEKKLKNNETRKSDLDTLKKMANELKSLADDLSSETGYLDVEADTVGGSVKVTTKPGTRIQSFDLDVKQLAQKQIYQSKGFLTDNVALGKGRTHQEMQDDTNVAAKQTLTFDFGEKDASGNPIVKELEITSDMSLKDIKDAIFEKSDGKIIASALNTGGDEPFSLVLKSTETGKANEFSVGGTLAGEFGFVEKQKAQDAIFVYDGVNVTRSTNKFDDLISGVSMTLSNTGKTSVEIKQNTSDIVENTEKFVNKYNEIMRNLNTVTKFDAEKKVKGTFQGNNEINTIKRQIRDSLLKTGASIEDFGFSLERTGEIRFDKSKLENKIKNNFDEVKNFFQGTYDKPGLFAEAKNTLYDLTTSNNGLFKLVEDGLKSRNKNLKEELKDAKANLESKYDIMVKQFAAYDAMIARMNASFASMKMMIEQSINGK